MKIEGRNSIYELLKTDKEIDKVLVQKDLKDDASKRLINVIRSNKVKVQLVDKYVIEKESESKRNQGFIAYVSDYKYFDIDDIIEDAKDKDGLVIVLNEILDPHNLGSIIRVCECAGADGIIISKDRSASVSDTVMRISAGALNHVKVARVTNINNAIDVLKDNGYWVYGAELGGSDMYKTNLTGKIALVIGGEDSGVKRLTKDKCDGIFSIPMYGKVNSLNASVACGIAVYEVLRQKNLNKQQRRKRLEKLTDEQLVDLAKKGENGAIDLLINRYKSKIVAICRSYFLIGGDSEDLLQEGMIAIFNAINTYNGQSSFSNYASVCVKNRVISTIRKYNNKKNSPLNDYMSLSLEDVFSITSTFN